MTIEQLLECSADQLEKMTDAEIEAHFKDLLVITRPDLAQMNKPAKTLSKANGSSPAELSKRQMLSEREQKAKEIASKMGLDIGDLFD